MTNSATMAAPSPTASLASMGTATLSEEFAELWKPWKGDLPGMLKRRVIRALVTPGTYLYYHQNGEPRGLVQEELRDLQRELNRHHGRNHADFVSVVPVPVARDRLVPDLAAGHGDLIATDLTITDERAQEVSFTRPWMRNVDEIVVTGPGAPELESVADLAGQDVFVRKDSSYAEHLQALNETLTPPIRIRDLPAIFEAEDILEMTASGLAPLTVMDAYKAEFWAPIFPGVQLRRDLVVQADNQLAWATRKDAPELRQYLDKFLKKRAKGTLIGNVLLKRYLADPKRLASAISSDGLNGLAEFLPLFRQYGEEFDFHWLQIAAQAYKESGMNPTARSRAGAVGLMQIKPATARDKNVGVNDISTPGGNVHAGVKYMRFLADRYFTDEAIPDEERWLFTLAAYNAGPARVIKLRNEAERRGLDRNRWVDNVEIVAAHRVGRETVRYVADISKYYLGYRLAWERRRALDESDFRPDRSPTEG